MKIPSRERYDHRKPEILTIINNNPTRLPYDLIGIISVSTGIPILIVCDMVGELTSFSPDLYSRIARLKLFYNIE